MQKELRALTNETDMPEQQPRSLFTDLIGVGMQRVASRAKCIAGNVFKNRDFVGADCAMPPSNSVHSGHIRRVRMEQPELLLADARFAPAIQFSKALLGAFMISQHRGVKA